jgi:hypothetical protein
MRYLLTYCIIFLGIVNSLFSQNTRRDSIQQARIQATEIETKNHTVFIELLGAGFPISINVEKRIPFSDKITNYGVSGSVGYNYRPEFLDSDIFGNSHVNFQLQISREHKRRTLGVGIASIWFLNQRSEIKEGLVLLLLKHSWRFRKRKNLSWGIAFTPAIRDQGTSVFTPFGSLSFGIKFGKARH